MPISDKRLSATVLFASFGALTGSSPICLADQLRSPPGYSVMAPKDAKQSLVGNSLKMSDGYYFFPNDYYAFYTSLSKEKHCTVWPWHLTEMESCRLDESDKKCDAYHVVKSGISDRKERGDKLGEFFLGKLPEISKLANSSADGEILQGNLTSCPTFLKALTHSEMSFSRHDLIRILGREHKDDTELNVSDEMISSVIVGNTLLLHQSRDDDICAGGVLYFSPDGRVISMSCGKNAADSSNQYITISIFVWHWREKDGHFEMDDPAALEDFDASIHPKLKFIFAERGSSDEHATVQIEDIYYADTSVKPTLIRGNLMEFKLPPDR